MIVGGAANYQTALHLMRTGAAGVIVGVGRRQLLHRRRRHGHPGAAGQRHRRRRGGPPRLPRRDRRPVRARHRQRPDRDQRRDRPRAGLRRRRRPARRAAADRRARRPAGGIWWDSVAAHPRLPRGGTSAPVAAGRLAGARCCSAPARDRRRAHQPVRRAAPDDGQDRLPRPQGVPAGRSRHRRPRDRELD